MFLTVWNDMPWLSSHSALSLTFIIDRFVRLPNDSYTPSNSLYNGSISAKQFGSPFRIQFTAHINENTRMYLDFSYSPRIRKYLAILKPPLRWFNQKNLTFLKVVGTCSDLSSARDPCTRWENFEYFEAVTPRWTRIKIINPLQERLKPDFYYMLSYGLGMGSRVSYALQSFILGLYSKRHLYRNIFPWVFGKWHLPKYMKKVQFGEHCASLTTLQFWLQVRQGRLNFFSPCIRRTQVDG